MPRPLYIIAADIYKNWPRAGLTALPYLHAMRHLNTLSDSYGQDSAQSIVLYFLSNAQSWRGEEARRLKSELKDMLKTSGYEGV
jgi:hypothetical protein